MLDWIVAHENLLMAVLGVFGAGGVGAIIIQRMLHGKDSSEKAAPAASTATIHTRASAGGMAATHTGTGSITMTQNAAISRSALESWRERLGLSLAAATRLFEVCERAAVSPEAIESLGGALDRSPDLARAPQWTALSVALEAKDMDRATKLLRALCGENDGQTKE